MGKSPGKWIKSVLFGKKTSKSSYSKNVARTSFISNAATTESTLEYPGISDPMHLAINQKNQNTEFENGSSTNLAHDVADILPADQGAIIGAAGIHSSADQTDIVRLEQAATKAQAVFRGYLARRAFKALKGIIRLQALIRGHLVRRQAVATLRCMQAIVKFQVLIRDHQVEILDSLPEEPKSLDLSGVDSVYVSEKLSRNGYFIKLISHWPSTPLVLQYEEAEPNSVWSWLQRWSVYRFWEQPKGFKKGVESKQQKKQKESWRSKRSTNQKVALSNGDSTVQPQPGNDHEKPKRHQKKTLVVGQSETAQEHPQSELERVKRNLRKVSLSAEEALEKSESVKEKPQRSNPRKISTSTPPPPPSPPPPPPPPQPQLPDDSQAATETVTEAAALEAVESPLVEAMEEQQIDEGEVSLETVIPPLEPPLTTMVEEEPDELATMKQEGEPLLENVNNGLEEIPKDQNKENKKTKRRKSLTGKQEPPAPPPPPPSSSSHENISHNITTTLPSYMAATESAKAKLRAQALAKTTTTTTSQQEAAAAAVSSSENNGFLRRHSLPSSSTNGKITSLSPRIQRPTKGRNTDRSLMSSRDDKQVQPQPGWRR